jgi:hypothetical protein
MMIEELEIISLSISEDYNMLKEKNCWEIYLSGISFGIYNMSDKSMTLQEIYDFLETDVLKRLN